MNARQWRRNSGPREAEIMIKKTQKAMKFGSHLTLFALLLSVACTHQQDRLIGENDLSYSEEGTVDVAATEGSVESSTDATGEEAAAPSEDLLATSEVAPEATTESTPSESQDVALLSETAP